MYLLEKQKRKIKPIIHKNHQPTSTTTISIIQTNQQYTQSLQTLERKNKKKKTKSEVFNCRNVHCTHKLDDKERKGHPDYHN